MKNRLIIALALLLLFSTYKLKKIPSLSKFSIKEIELENNHILKDREIKKNLTFIYGSNLFFLSTSQIKKNLKEISFIESFELKKSYPNKIKIKIFEKKPIAILQDKKNKFYISQNFDLINYKELEKYKILPIVFGNEKNFKIFYNELKKINFPTNTIKKYYFFESKRWDLETHSKILIKLPSQNYNKSLKNFMELSKDYNFDKYKVFDYRINNQLILK